MFRYVEPGLVVFSRKGGYSLGGVLAYESARTLLSSCEDNVSLLLLLDTPALSVVPPSHPSSIQRFAHLGILGAHAAGGPKHDLIPHRFSMSVIAAREYKPRPIGALPAGLVMPKCVAIWAGGSVEQRFDTYNNMERREVDALKRDDDGCAWILGFREGGRHGGGKAEKAWEDLMHGGTVVHSTVGGDHFSLVSGNATVCARSLVGELYANLALT